MVLAKKRGERVPPAADAAAARWTSLIEKERKKRGVPKATRKREKSVTVISHSIPPC